MPTLSINTETVTVPEGATLLQAIRSAGFDVPTLCTHTGRRPLSSCYLCAVQIRGAPALQPACAARAAEGQEVSTTSAEVQVHRRITLEMLFSHHAGDCDAPCTQASRAGVPIPELLRQIQRGDFRGAAALLMAALPFPESAAATLLAASEKACRRGSCDAPIGIRRIVALLAGNGAAEDVLQPSAGKAEPATRIAVLGSGPAGLAAAAFLCMRGCRVELFGRPSPELWPQSMQEGETAESLQNDIDRILRAVSNWQSNLPCTTLEACARFAEGYHATLLTAESGLPLPIPEKPAFPSPVFAAPWSATNARSVAEICARVRPLTRQLLEAPGTTEKPAENRPFSFNCSLGRLRDDREKQQLLAMAPAPSAGRLSGEDGVPADAREAVREAKRCMHCDCRKAQSCRLRQAAEELQLKRPRNAQTRPDLEIVRTGIGILFEPGKCIHCGRCIEITETEGEPVGLTWSGRGFGVRVSPPPGVSWGEALQHTADTCVAACPTGALAYEEERQA